MRKQNSCREQAAAAWAVRIHVGTRAKRAAQAHELASSYCQLSLPSALSLAVGLPLAPHFCGFP